VTKKICHCQKFNNLRYFFYINTKCIHIRSSLRSRHPQGFKSVQNKIKLCFTGA